MKVIPICFMLTILMHQLWFTCAVSSTRNQNILLWGTPDGHELDLNDAANGKDSTKEGSVSRRRRRSPPPPRPNPPIHELIVVPPAGPSPSSSPPSSPPPSRPCYHHRLGCIRPYNVDDY
ncbi:OLC1v1026501C1 [Oldenlandia corymbosa var. corymbosa]|uniref:OLC1v1026501C1 n=1 Tax=Oldenlandia corymbosa var. corymbosa TaxID=529605 RepID=A0AAV1C7T7_OLDCO|nr:OLC1v1026501C1 [Oldenlandia corymbosa var. corymbosa]